METHLLQLHTMRLGRAGIKAEMSKYGEYKSEMDAYLMQPRMKKEDGEKDWR